MSLRERLTNWVREIPRRELWIVGAAMLTSFLLVAGYVVVRHGDPLAGDELDYNIMGQFFAKGKLWWGTQPFGNPHPTAWKTPIYPAWIGFWYSVLGSSPTRVELVQAFIAPISVALTWILARRLFSPRIAIAAAIVVAVFPFAWEYYGLLFSEALAIPVTLLTLIAFLGYKSISPARAMAVGALIGVGMLIRPTSVFLFAGVLVAFWIAMGFKRGVGLTALAAVVAALCIAPWTIRNAVEFNAFLPLSVQDGALAGTFNDDAANDPTYPYAWRPVPKGQAWVYAQKNKVNDAELRNRLRKIGTDYIKDHPGSLVKAYFWNGITRTWDIRRPARAMNEVPYEGRSKPVSAVGLGMYYLLLPLAIFGLWRLRSRKDLLLPVIAMAFASSVVFTVDGGTRYRATLEPLIVILACCAVFLPRRSETANGDFVQPSALPSTTPAASVPSRTL
jgi:4-amino-4-deoxy-L-arabinose transferase-like glycosyltransferase